MRMDGRLSRLERRHVPERVALGRWDHRLADDTYRRLGTEEWLPASAFEAWLRTALADPVSGLQAIVAELPPEPESEP